MCPLAFAPHFWYKFCASLLTAQYFCNRALQDHRFQR
jgi:hypothetical protein